MKESHLTTFSEILIAFWSWHPALLYGIAFLFGIALSLSPSYALILPYTILAFPYVYLSLSTKKPSFLVPLSLAALVFITGYSYAASIYTLPQIPSEGIIGTAHLKINSLTLQSTPFGKNWLYRCEIKQFIPKSNAAIIHSTFPCTVIIPGNTPSRQPADKEYWVTGTLKRRFDDSYTLKVSPKTNWEAISNTYSFAELRFSWKRKVSQWVEAQFSHAASGEFLAGLVTGEFNDYWMKQQFGRFGLQHLLAISGFHFAIIAAFLAILFRCIFSRQVCLIALICCLGLYSFFLGPQPSILRAWLMSSLVLMAGLIERQSTALNSLGAALLVILAYNPLLCLELGFQLSFAITASILLLYSPAHAFCCYLFPKRTLSDILKMNGWNQHAYCILAFFRQALALTLAVNLIAFPLTLYYFQQFQWLSLLYNLFFPFLATLSLCLLLVGSIFSLFPFLGTIIHSLNDHYTLFLLQMTFQIPNELDHTLRVSPFDDAWFLSYLCLIYLGGVIFKQRMESPYASDTTFTFI